MNERAVQFWVGVMVVSTCLIAAILVLLLGNKPAMFESTYTVYIDFSDAPGVTKYTPVRKSGILIGRVDDFKLLRDGGVRLTVGIHTDVEIPKNEICEVRNTLLGDAEVEFFLPPDSPASPESVREGDILKGHRAMDPLVAVANLEQSLSSVVGSVAATSESMGKTIEKINTLLDKNEDHINSIVQRTDETLKLVQDTAKFSNDLLNDCEFRDKMKAEVIKLPDTLREARDTIVQLKTTMQNMDHTMGLVDRNLENIKDFTQPLGENGRNIVNQIDDSVRRLNNLMVEMESFGKSLNSEEGTLGRLVKDDELYQRLNRTVRNVEEISYRLKPIVNDARIVSDKLARHPGSILRDAVRPGPGTKGLPPSNAAPANCPTQWQPSSQPTTWME